jgi:glycine/D-amino acid oxidase-like deaminating enzyme
VDADAIRRSYAEAKPRPFWLDQADAPQATEPLAGEHEADLLIVGGGLTGLWAALLEREEEPQREVILVEGERIALGASGRNGGFMDASLTHGIENGAPRWPDEMPELERLGREHFAATKDTIARRGIEANLEQTGELAFATAPY